MTLKAKAKKINHLERTYWKAFRSALKNSWTLPVKQRIEYQSELGFIHQKVMEYGFEFYPTHYIRDHVMEMRDLSKKIRTITGGKR